MTVKLEAETEAPEVGPQLAITATKGSKKLALALTAAGEPLGQAEVEAQGDTCPVAVERRGEYIVVLVDGQRALTAAWTPAGGP